jgi:hypothetical protein
VVALATKATIQVSGVVTNVEAVHECARFMPGRWP